jgi:hypothetical protein
MAGGREEGILGHHGGSPLARPGRSAASTENTGQTSIDVALRNWLVQTRAQTAKKASADAENACYRRPDASGDIYVRMITPGLLPQAQELGGEWGWNHILSKCETSVQMMISTAPMTAGNCTQVGYVADNPGYYPNATPAAPLKNVVTQAGPAC